MAVPTPTLLEVLSVRSRAARWKINVCLKYTNTERHLLHMTHISKHHFKAMFRGNDKKTDV